MRAGDGAPPAALEIRAVSLAFGGTKALDGVSFPVEAGTIHGLVGGNGSGKSSLIKILAGVYRADAGEIVINGRVIAADRNTPAAAHAAGLRFVHQDLGLFGDMTVAENIALSSGYPVSRLGRVHWSSLRRTVAGLLEQFEVEVSPATMVSELRPAEKTMLAVARALKQDGDTTDGQHILILDEPTVSLPGHEVDVLFRALRRRAAQQQTIVFVSHRLQEVLSFADYLTVLRDGRTVTTRTRESVSEAGLIEMIAGRPLDRIYPSAASTPQGPPVAEVRHLRAGPLLGLNLAVRAGEVVGVTGLEGSGGSALLRAVFGDQPASGGTVRVGSAQGPFRGPRQAMSAGVGYVPADRLGEAAFPDLPVLANLSITVNNRYFKRLWLWRRLERRAGAGLQRAFRIRAGSLDDPLVTLSGGNQQKVILARWMQRQPGLLLLDEPTQGVDVGARADIYRLIRQIAADQAGIVIVSSDFDELAHLCDRVAVLEDGAVKAEIARDELTARALYEATHGSAEEET